MCSYMKTSKMSWIHDIHDKKAKCRTLKIFIEYAPN